jgi:hypothetical protein
VPHILQLQVTISDEKWQVPNFHRVLPPHRNQQLQAQLFPCDRQAPSPQNQEVQAFRAASAAKTPQIPKAREVPTAYRHYVSHPRQAWRPRKLDPHLSAKPSISKPLSSLVETSRPFCLVHPGESSIVIHTRSLSVTHLVPPLYPERGDTTLIFLSSSLSLPVEGFFLPHVQAVARL